MLEDLLNKKYGDVLDQIWIKEKDYGFVLDAIVIKKGIRNDGIGSKVMNYIINYADKNNKIATLTPSTSYGSSIGRLTQFYKNFGFKNNKGGNKDFRFMQTMIRYPKGMNENKIKGGLADNKSMHDMVHHHGEESWASIQFESLEQQLEKQLEKGVKAEMEHTSDVKVAREIAMDHIWEDRKYYDKLETMEENKVIIKRLLKEEIDLQITDESPDTITILVEYNDRNAGIIMVTPANAENTLEIVGIKFKKDYETVFILNEAVKSLWGMFKETNDLIVAPKPEGIAFWNKLGFKRISPNYLILSRGH